MPPRRPADEKLARALSEIDALTDNPDTPAARAVLARALAGGVSFVVAAAARLIREQELHGHGAALVAAFARFETDGAKTDPGCRAKLAVIEALVALGLDEPELYLRATALRQMEKAFGPPVDTAIQVRCQGVAGLARALRPNAAVAGAELLADVEWDARAGAARTLALCSREAAEPVLRHKLRAGDKEPQVLGECLRALLALAPDTLPFAAGFLAADDEAVAEQAALAIGDSRLEDAYAVLARYAEEVPMLARRAPVLLGIALLRSDRGFADLLARVAEADAGTAEAAVAALAIYKDDEKLRERVLEAARARGEAAFVRAVAEKLGVNQPSTR